MPDEIRVQRSVRILRALADWLEQHPVAEVSLPGMWSERMFQAIHPRDKEELGEMVRNIGTCIKRPCASNPADFEFVVQLLPDFEVVFWCHRDQVCTPRVVGKKIVPEEIIPEKITPAHEVDVIEWDCPESVLAPAEEDALPEEYIQGPEYVEVKD